MTSRLNNTDGLFTLRFGIFSTTATTALTLITFAIAINTPPISGVFCTENCIEYPYLHIADRFPKDYLWMFPAIVLNICFLFSMIAFHYFTREDRKVFSFTAVTFAVISMSTLNIDYFLQLTVIQPALLNNETSGISMLTQYNPHGIFIAMEEFGYLMMSFTFLFAGLAYPIDRPFGAFLKWFLILSFLISMVALIWIRVSLGLNTGYIFEIVIISINWITLLVMSILLIFVFYRSTKLSTDDHIYK
jgi:hypothetical protein